jgi:hypothetical protein
LSDISSPLPEKINKTALPNQISRTTSPTTEETGSKLPIISKTFKVTGLHLLLKLRTTLKRMKMNKQEEKQYHIKNSLNRTLLLKMKIAKSMKSLLMSSICIFVSSLSVCARRMGMNMNQSHYVV